MKRLDGSQSNCLDLERESFRLGRTDGSSRCSASSKVCIFVALFGMSPGALEEGSPTKVLLRWPRHHGLCSNPSLAGVWQGTSCCLWQQAIPMGILMEVGAGSVCSDVLLNTDQTDLQFPPALGAGCEAIHGS